MAGWIKISRDIVNHWVWSNESWRGWWLDLLMMAAWKDEEILYEGCKVALKRGQLFASVRNLAKRWNANETAVYRFLLRLEDEGMIYRGYNDVKHQVKHQVKHLTICNYDKYQVGVKQVVKHQVKQETKETSPIPPKENNNKEINKERDYGDNNINIISPSSPKKGCDHEVQNEESERYAKFKLWVSTNAPWCFHNLKMITEVQFYILLKTYTPQEVSETILELENYCKRDKYKDLYLTVRQWLRKRDGTAI